MMKQESGGWLREREKEKERWKIIFEVTGHLCVCERVCVCERERENPQATAHDKQNSAFRLVARLWFRVRKRVARFGGRRWECTGLV